MTVSGGELNVVVAVGVIREGLLPYLADNCQAWEMDAEGGYTRGRPRRGRRRSAQEELLYTLATPS